LKQLGLSCARPKKIRKIRLSCESQAKDASEEAVQRARRLAAEALEAKKAVADAERNLEQASRELRSLLEK